MSVLTVRAASLEALAFEQGRRTVEVAEDRLLEDLAHVQAVTGTVWDEFWSRSLLVRTARRAHERLDDETRGFVDAYAAGVRAAGIEDWQDWTSLGVFAVHHALFGSLGHHLWRRHAARVLGSDAARALAQEVPALSGSNAWVVGGRRSTDGAPLIGADPHRIVTVPSVYQRVHLVAGDADVDVVGLTFPGVPGVQHFGHTGTVAWAITNAMADTQRLVDVEADTPRDVVEGVSVTADGPIVLERPDGSGVAVRSVPWLLDDLGFAAFVPLLRARTTADVDAALDHWVEPVNDVLVADVDGAVLHRVAGRVPWRETSGEWSGWVVPHRRRVGPTEHAVVANHRQGGHSAALADELVTDAQRPAFEAYREEVRRASEIERLATDRPKTGVDLGVTATNPVTGEQIPVWATDYVLADYGTGAIMAVPAHDQRDSVQQRQHEEGAGDVEQPLPQRHRTPPPGRPGK